MVRRIHFFLTVFILPCIVLTGIIAFLILSVFNFTLAALIVILIAIGIGSYKLVVDTGKSILAKQFALDYIAILAIAVAILTREYLVGSIIALMIASGRTLEEYGVSQAKKSLTKLIDRIPSDVILWKNSKEAGKIKIGKVTVGQEIFIRKGEVIPLDGILLSESGLTDESSLTGEPYIIEKGKGDQMRSGTINIGNPMTMKVTRVEKDSTYTKIINMVKKAQTEKAPLVRLADKYSAVFTIITLLIAIFAWIYSQGNLRFILAVLVIATPCPLLLATPIALLGGVNAAAKKRIIVKKLASIETLSRIQAVIFDKTGTITLGRPRVAMFENLTNAKISDQSLISIAAGIERNSLHSLAKAIVAFAKEEKTLTKHATNVEEKIGKGISGTIDNQKYQLSKLPIEGMAIGLFQNKKQLAVFRFEDEIKSDAKTIIARLEKLGLSLFIFTGDKQEAADQVAATLGGNVTVKAKCSPEDKQNGIEKLQKMGKTVVMIGDGINDAPALALANVGMVFSNEEQTAATDAADIVFLGGDFSLVYDSLIIAKQTIHIALQSILVGIGMSIFGMILASVGLIPPIAGAFLQEAIDVAVILNALRASRYT